ncbi:MAG: excinuclease ABC subunit C [Candidatus Moeniiplasma glomeromycotorum]|nr:excinuclease ABC subunit C [Candidatus Moeniiplasma glomeromycotorum]MCE8167661.1 excinuclease ABC subunit C [Candidatus Moeniiplasma glomeromycotorum]MCE8168988.1 excinuclease ABC subunit C [Candidatus Moeniiplasma glomeromycotorum]
MPNNSLTHEISHLTEQPGCYLFLNSQGTIIYIGRAQNLKRRVSSYFMASTDYRSEIFFQQIANFKTIITDTLKEALILEQNLIKKYRPHFNVLLKDNHYYPYLTITRGENPRYRIVQKIDPTCPDKYFGPFPEGSKAYEILPLLERLFPLAKCRGKLGQPCIYYEIGQCSGHCFQKVTPDYYEKKIKQVKDFFAGRTQEIKQKIKQSMKKNITDLAFEIAQKQKKILDNLDFFISKQNIEFVDRQNCNFLGIFQQTNTLSVYLLIYRYGKLTTTNEATFLVQVSPEEVLETYLYQFYQNNLSPQILYVPKKTEGLEIIAHEFDFKLKVPQRGRKKEILALAQVNAQQVWQKNYWNEFQQVNKEAVLSELSRFLSIPIPYRIECLDVSNLYKQDVVAGFLAFSNGEKDLTRSKLYKINVSEQEWVQPQQSDLARIKNACSLHYRKCSTSAMPDLIIVDGGKEQVKAVQQVLRKLTSNKVSIPVIGLAKNEKHQTAKVITPNGEELGFEKAEKIKNFLTNCQTEVHRYALNFHRKLHRRNVLK